MTLCCFSGKDPGWQGLTSGLPLYSHHLQRLEQHLVYDEEERKRDRTVTDTQTDESFLIKRFDKFFSCPMPKPKATLSHLYRYLTSTETEISPQTVICILRCMMAKHSEEADQFYQSYKYFV